MIDLASYLPSIANDVIEDWRGKELELQLKTLDWLFPTSIDERLAKLGEPALVMAKCIKKAIVDGKRIEVEDEIPITGRGMAGLWSVVEKKDPEKERKKQFEDKGFLQLNPSVVEMLNTYRFYPHTGNITGMLSAWYRAKTDKNGKPAKYALVENDPELLRWFNVVCELITLNGQVHHFFPQGRRAFLAETRASFTMLRAHWAAPANNIRSTHHAHNEIGIGAEARATAMAELGDINTDSLISQINSNDVAPEDKLALMERLLRFREGVANLSDKYADIAKKDINIVQELQVPVVEKFNESSREAQQFIREDLVKREEVQRKLREAVND
jgi:hypothetical protein